METFSALLALCVGNSPVTGEFPAQRPMTRSFGVFFDLRLNKQLKKQSWGWWFETPSRSLCSHCNEENNSHAIHQHVLFTTKHVHIYMFLRIDVGIKGKHVRDTGSSSRFLEILAAEIIWSPEHHWYDGTLSELFPKSQTPLFWVEIIHYNDVIMGVLTSQITSFTIVYPTVYSGTDERKHQSSASLAFVWGIQRRPHTNGQ